MMPILTTPPLLARSVLARPVFARALLAGAILIASAVLYDGAAHAQAGNLPYQAGGAGISTGARQAILNARLLGNRPANLVRDGAGGLLDVSRRGNQAFLSSPGNGAFLPGARPGRGWAAGLGTGLGWGLFPANASLASYYGRSNHPAESMMQWISLLGPGISRMSAEGMSPLSDAASPLDAWIFQADLS
ncbi:hypothetical protein [Ferrovibrio sp.]|uniref:hypothetical protein n=1 Tax=Ferrovibrio sp. TaxID=1917215 RepID=UPI001B469AE1|nr:hypothetical protein [Ferrovibrio sp.]MBP7063141.1 hypothetical protein [Ferrovibrio sp.]